MRFFRVLPLTSLIHSLIFMTSLYGVANKRPLIQQKRITKQINHDMVFLLVDKSKLRANLMTWPKDPQDALLLMSFKIAIGKEEGDKQFEGDNKTPEGIYFAQKIMDGSILPPKYGPKAIPIDFPNPFDRILGKTGHGIWLHGVEMDQRIEAAKVTEGCIAFFNADIVTLTSFLKPHQSIIMITKDSKFVNTKRDLGLLKKATRAWEGSWQNGDLEKYIGFYHKNFRHRNKNLSEFEKYKKRVFSSYRKMTINMTNLRVFSHQGYGISIMNQDFYGDKRYRSKGRKILYWIKMPQIGWQIYYEKFETRRLKFQSLSFDEISRVRKTSPSAKLFHSSNNNIRKY